MTFKANEYHPDWKSISRQIREQAGNACEFCGVPNGAVGARDRSGRWHDLDMIDGMNSDVGYSLFGDDYPRIITIVLTTAHLCWETCANKKCIDPTHLRSLCQRCHLNYDRKHHLDVQKANREQRKADAIAATGQVVLL